MLKPSLVAGWTVQCVEDHLTDLELGVALEQQHVNHVELTDVAVPLELLADLCTDSGNGEVQGVHGLDFGGLCSEISYLSMHLQLGVVFALRLVYASDTR